jgi:diguanylate cyclase (GGDEF)-like protein
MVSRITFASIWRQDLKHSAPQHRRVCLWLKFAAAVVDVSYMTSEHSLAVAPVLPVADDQTPLVMIRDRGMLDGPHDPVFDRLTRALRRNTGAVVAGLCLVDAAREWVESVCTVDGTVTRVSEPAVSESFELYLLAVAVLDGASDASRLFVGAPVTIGERVVGQVGIAATGVRAWAEADLEALHDTADAVSTELSLRLAKKEAEQVHLLVASHNKVHEMIARAAPIRGVLVEVCESIQRCDPSLLPSVLMLDPVSSTLHSGVGPSLPADYLAAIDGVVIGPNIGTCGPAAWFGRLTISPNLAEDPKWAPILALARGAGLAHCWSMPIRAAGGEILGTLALYGREPREPLPEHVALLHDWGRIAGIAIERSQALGRLTYDARHDGLTGLPNRLAIFEELDEAIQRAQPEAAAAVLFLDLDGLKALNDTLGHDRADEMIREIGQRLSKTIRGKDFVGRFGGDEFIVIAEGIADPDEAGRLGARLLDAIAQPVPGLDSAVLTASIGITMVRSNSVEPREAIRDADAAMYVAKRSGRDRCVFSEVEHGAHAGRRLQLARELRGAETRGEMRLVFQPVLALSTMQIVGVEALLRWRSPTFGEVSPNEFISIAEDTGTIVPIGAWVLRESCEEMTRLADLGHRLELDVNVSTTQASSQDFPLWVRQTLAHAQFPASLLGLKITETALMRHHTLTKQNLRELAVEVRIVLDDFGMGHSSLTWLKQHRFGAIQIDRSFISGLPDDKGDRAIVAAVTSMAKALECTVTADGVETEEQLATLRALGCDRAQGPLLGQPVPASELAALLAPRERFAI